MASLSERLDSFPEAWKPTTPGEKLIGELTEVDFRDSEYGDPYPILTVQSEADGQEYAWHAFHTMARNEVARKKPQPGDRIGIVYAGVGEASSPGMNPPVRWRLLVDRAEPTAVDYAGLADDEEEADDEDEEEAGDGIPF